MIKNFNVLLVCMLFCTIAYSNWNDKVRREHDEILFKVRDLKWDIYMSDQLIKDIAQTFAEKEMRDRWARVYLQWFYSIFSNNIADDETTAIYYKKTIACSSVDKKEIDFNYGKQGLSEMERSCSRLAERMENLAPKTKDPQATEMKAQEILRYWK